LKVGFKENKSKKIKKKKKKKKIIIIISIDKREGEDQRNEGGKRKNRGYNHVTWSLCVFSQAQGVGGANW
jgi:hypothetical protein